MRRQQPNRFLSFAAAAFAALLLLAQSAFAANDKVALLIGNNKYSTGALRNAVNDAKDLAEVLKELGFKVIVREDATKKDMFDAIVEFGKALEGANVALFFYAGHGMQFKDQNYLIPIDITMGSEEDVTFFGISLQQVFDRMDKARTRQNFIVLDACRDNPFASSFKLSSAGLAQMNAPAGTLIAYATAPGSVAQDGFKRNGVYTQHILRNIKVPDVPVETMFKRVREGVELETRKQQVPWDSSSLKGDFAFNPTGTAVAAAPRSAAPSTDVALTVESEFWRSVRESKRPEDYQAYLEKYPNGSFAPLARNSLEALKRASPAEPMQLASAEAPISRAVDPRAAEPKPPAVPPTSESKAAAEPLPAKSQPTQAAPPPAQAAPQTPQPEKPVVVAAAPAVAPPASPPPAAAIIAPAVGGPAAATPPAAPPKDDSLGREVAPGVREVVFADGATYRGGVRGTMLHGKGQYVGKAFKYEGEYKDGLKEGMGTYVWANGNTYEGPFVNDLPHGRGKYIFANGDVYTGEMKAGIVNGRGIYVTKAGDTLEGTFVDGSLHGPGTHRFASGDRYEGENVKGRPQGKGRYFGTDGRRVEGDFVDGLPHGKAIYEFANGDRYEGDIANGELTGKGSYTYKAGARYDGEMLKGQPQGEGVYFFPDGSRFEGKFENGLAKAVGRVVRPDGSSTPSEIVNGQTRATP